MMSAWISGCSASAARALGPVQRKRAVHHCAVNAKGVPAKPQYPLVGSDEGGSLVSHRHIMQPDPGIGRNSPSSGNVGVGKTSYTVGYFRDWQTRHTFIQGFIVHRRTFEKDAFNPPASHEA